VARPIQEAKITTSHELRGIAALLFWHGGFNKYAPRLFSSVGKF